MGMDEAVRRVRVTGTRLKSDATRYLRVDCTAQDSRPALSGSDTSAAQKAVNSANIQHGGNVQNRGWLEELRGFDGATDPTHPKLTSVGKLKSMESETCTKARYVTVSHQDYRNAVCAERQAKLKETKIDMAARTGILRLCLNGTCNNALLGCKVH